MVILELYIDGYKNISQTTITLHSPVSFILSRNNFGKTNLLNGIKEGFAFLNLGPLDKKRYLTKGTFLKRFIADEQVPNFTFGIKFKKDSNSSKTYVCQARSL